MNMPYINLFTTYYNEKNEIRKKEYQDAIFSNIENPLIQCIYILHEEDCLIPFRKDKIKSIIIKGRPTFSQFFKEINSNTQKSDINIISNTDIYFNDSISLCGACGINEVFTLNRWDVINEQKVSLFAKYSSSDSWVFKGHIRNVEANYYLGQLGCDNKILYDLNSAGYIIKNPSLSIFSFHLHQSNVRGDFSNPKGKKRIPAPYIYTIPNFLNFKLFFKQSIRSGLRVILRMLITRRNIKFQYFYDFKNDDIEHVHQIIGAKAATNFNYWVFHDFLLPLNKLNIYHKKSL